MRGCPSKLMVGEYKAELYMTPDDSPEEMWEITVAHDPESDFVTLGYTFEEALCEEIVERYNSYDRMVLALLGAKQLIQEAEGNQGVLDDDDSRMVLGSIRAVLESLGDDK